MRPHQVLTVVGCLAFALAGGASAAAQEALLNKVFACADLAEAGKRHACYDALGPDLKAAELARRPADPALAAASPGAGAGAGAAAAPAAAKPSPAETFGQKNSAGSPLTAATVEPKAKTPGAPKEKDITRVRQAVRSIQKGGDGRLRFTLENGQVWKQADDTSLRALGNTGPWTAEVWKGALGTYLLSVNKMAAIRVERAQ